MLISVRAGKIDRLGAIVGGVISYLIFLGAGYTGIAMLAAFFILGSAATSVSAGVKEKLGVAEENRGRRSAGQAIANAGVAGILGLLIYFFPEKSYTMRLMMAASLASAIADTLSSELGTVYGRRFYNILSLKKDQRGLNGVISLEGTLIGIAGSGVIAIIYSFGFGWTNHELWIIIAGTIGNLADSILGATFERRRYLSNNAVNFLNTLIAAFTALILSYL
jgi:uncharacterized protein (TIGR00297 family)